MDPPSPSASASAAGKKRHLLKQRFQVIKKLGQGTYGKVQLAINKESGQDVAIKTIRKSMVETEQDLVRIRREIQIMSSIQHPHIIHIYEGNENTLSFSFLFSLFSISLSLSLDNIFFFYFHFIFLY